MPTNKPVPPKDSNRSPLIAVTALIVVAGAAYGIYRFKLSPPASETALKKVGTEVFSGAETARTSNTKPIESIGMFFADEVLRIIGNSGTIALVREVRDPKAPNTGQDAQAWNAVAAQIETFKDWLKRNGKFTFLPETKLVRAENTTTTAWSAGQFARLLQEIPPNATIIVYCVLPENLTQTEKTLLRNRSGKVIVLGGIEPLMKPLVQERLIHLAVTLRMPPTPPKGDETPSQMARRVYTVLKSGEAGQPQ